MPVLLSQGLSGLGRRGAMAGRRRRGVRATLLCFIVAAQARGASFDTGSALNLRWDNTLRATFGFRTGAQDQSVLADANADDGDRAFKPGPISERIDVLSELDLSLGDAGLTASAEGWYDAAYHGRDANRNGRTFNPVSVPPDRFPAATETLEGGRADLLNAYVHDRFDLGGPVLTLRLGRQTLLWGESLFFSENAIEAGQAPVDLAKALAEPLATAKELFLPVTQAVAILQLRPDLGLQAYIQSEWRPDRLPGVASYFSTADFLDAGGEQLFYDGFTYFRGADRAPSGHPQFGLALRYSSEAADFGLYALRANAKSPELYLQPATAAVPGGPVFGGYGLIYPQGIDFCGGSVSTYLGESTLAGEVSLRRHMPLVSALTLPAGGNVAAFYAGQPYAVGETLHAQISLQATLPGALLIPGASLEAEFAANDRLSVERDPGSLAPGRDRFASAFRAVYAAQFYHVLPHLDVTVPVGFGYNLTGNSSVFGGQNAHGGDVELGVEASWHVVWQGAVNVTHFLGSPAHQPLADRDFVTLTFSRSF